MDEYDSTDDTLAHIAVVKDYLNRCAAILTERGVVHDASKLVDPEKSFFDKCTPMLEELTYGSEDYADALHQLKPALDRHYAANSHHPEHFSYLECGACYKEFPDDFHGNCDECGYGVYWQKRGVTGISGMDLFDVIEMLVDWKAASERHDDGDIVKSLIVNHERFQLQPQLYDILINTCVSMGFFPRGTILTKANPSGQGSNTFAALA